MPGNLFVCRFAQKLDYTVNITHNTRCSFTASSGLFSSLLAVKNDSELLPMIIEVG